MSCPFAPQKSTNSPPSDNTMASSSSSLSNTSQGLSTSKTDGGFADIDVSQCPAFKSGCPFSGTKQTPENVANLVKEIPQSHLDSRSETSKQFMSAIESINRVRLGSSSDSDTASNDGESPGNLSAKLEIFSLWNTVVQEIINRAEQIKKDVEETDQAIEDEGKDMEAELSKLLKDGTKVSHREAESVSFVKNFIRGRIERTHYSQMQVGLYYVYEAMEKAIDKNRDHLQTLYLPEKLRRLPSLESDLEYLLGKNWKSENPPSQATLDYVRRIEEVAASDPVRLISHSYTRYLGDLSGGQILKKRAKAAMQLPENALQFYEFHNIKEGAKAFKNDYRRFLDNLRFENSDNGAMSVHDRLVGEANVAFVLNMRLFEELDVAAGLEGASVRPYFDATKYYEMAGSKVESNAACPFGFTGPNPHGGKSKVNKSEKKKSSKSEHGDRCPWPFVFFHDPMTGIRDWQTFAVLGVVSCWAYSKLKAW